MTGIITSKRNFGVEIEFHCEEYGQIVQIAKSCDIIRDGSLDRFRYAGECVSPILNGHSGEEYVKNLCGVLKENDAIPVSLHIHLDGLKYGDGYVIGSPTKPSEYTPGVVAFSNKLEVLLKGKGITITDVFRCNLMTVRPLCHTQEYGGITYLSINRLKEEPTKGFTYYKVNEEHRFDWLKKVLYFYTLHSQVMEMMVQNSRRFGNMYCTPLRYAFTTRGIKKCNTMNDLTRLWYKGRMRNSKFDNSRYKDVNLHSYWHHPGTVEIRSHGGTIDPYKILMWVRLHQRILDKLEVTSIDDIKKAKTDLLNNFVSFIDDKLIEEYVHRMITFYSEYNL